MAAVQSITQQLNESVQAWAARLNAFLSSLGACSLQDFDLTRRDVRPTIQLVAAVTYQSPGSVLAGATAFVGDGTTSGQALANAFLAANPTYRVLFMRDASNPHRRSLNDDVVLLVYSRSVLSNCAQGKCSIVIAQAVADIAPGDTGAALLVTAAGASATSMQVNNRSGLTWPAGARGYAAPILGSCTWAGVASCCVAPPPTTTSTTSSTTSTTTTTTTTTTTSTSTSTTTPPPSGPSDLTNISSINQGYFWAFINRAEVLFELLTPVPGETVTIDPQAPSGGLHEATVTSLSGPPAVDNGDGTYTFTFTTGLETVQIQIDYDGAMADVVSGLMPYTCKKLPGADITGSIQVDAGGFFPN